MKHFAVVRVKAVAESIPPGKSTKQRKAARGNTNCCTLLCPSVRVPHDKQPHGCVNIPSQHTAAGVQQHTGEELFAETIDVDESIAQAALVGE